MGRRRLHSQHVRQRGSLWLLPHLSKAYLKGNAHAGCEADAVAKKEPAVRLSRSTDASSMRMVSNADGSYTAGSPALSAGARVEHCFSTQAGERIRLVQILSSQTDGEQHTHAEPLPLLGFSTDCAFTVHAATNHRVTRVPDSFCGGW